MALEEEKKQDEAFRSHYTRDWDRATSDVLIIHSLT